LYKAQIDNTNALFLYNESGISKRLKRLIIRAIDQNKIRSDVSAESLTNELLMMVMGVIYNWCISDGNVDVLGNVKKMASNYIQLFQV